MPEKIMPSKENYIFSHCRWISNFAMSILNRTFVISVYDCMSQSVIAGVLLFCKA